MSLLVRGVICDMFGVHLRGYSCRGKCRERVEELTSGDEAPFLFIMNIQVMGYSNAWYFKYIVGMSRRLMLSQCYTWVACRGCFNTRPVDTALQQCRCYRFLCSSSVGHYDVLFFLSSSRCEKNITLDLMIFDSMNYILNPWEQFYRIWLEEMDG